MKEKVARGSRDEGEEEGRDRKPYHHENKPAKTLESEYTNALKLPNSRRNGLIPDVFSTQSMPVVYKKAYDTRRGGRKFYV